MKYFTSDPHFGHENVIKYERTQFNSIEEHDEKIKSIYSKLQKQDELYILGDISLSNKTDINFIKDLECKTILIKGNHDKFNSNYYTSVFDEVYDTPLYITKRIVLSHIPIQVGNNILNIHGHMHDSDLSLPNYKNVNIHVNNYKLFSLKDAELIVSELPIKSIKFLEEWYAPYTHFYNYSGKKHIILKDNGDIDYNRTMNLNM